MNKKNVRSHTVNIVSLQLAISPQPTGCIVSWAAELVDRDSPPLHAEPLPVCA